MVPEGDKPNDIITAHLLGISKKQRLKDSSSVFQSFETAIIKILEGLPSTLLIRNIPEPLDMSDTTPTGICDKAAMYIK